MAEQFDYTPDAIGGEELTPAPELDSTGQTTAAGQPPIPMPDITPIVASMPKLAAPQLPPPPPRPMDDPRQKLLSLFTTMFALGAGPRSGQAAGALHGLSLGQQALQQDQLDRWKFEVGRQQQQQRIIEQQQAELDRQRTINLQNNLQKFSQAAANAPSKEEYDRLADAYGNGLAAMGYRITPNWLRSSMPYMQPSEKATAEKAYQAFLSNPNNAAILKNPELASKAMVTVDLNGDGVKENIPLTVLADKAGHAFATDDQGQLLSVPKEQAGTGAFDVKLNALMAQFRAENRREPTPQERNKIVDQANQAVAEKHPEMDALNTTLRGLQIQVAEQNLKDKKDTSGGLTPEGLDYAATQYRITGAMPSMGMGNRGARTAIINAAAQQAKAMGQSPAQAIQKQAAYKADSASLQQMRKASSSAEAFETKALAQAEIVSDLSNKVSRTQWPIINSAVIAGKTQIAGDPQATQLVNAIQTFTNEYAKIMEGSTGSAAASTESARHAAERLINAKMNQGTVTAVLELMKREMALTIQGYDATIDHITTRMGGAPPAPAPETPSAAPKGTGGQKIGRFEVTVKG